MYSNNSFGNFYPVDSSIHRLNPIIKLINFIIAIILIIFSMSLEVHLFLTALLLIMAILSSVPTRFYFKTFYSLRFLYILIAFFCYSFGLYLNDTIVYLLKLIIIVEYIVIIIYTTSPSELNYGIEKILNIFNIFGFKISGIVVKITNTIRFIPLVITTENKILKSQASRGIDYSNSDIFGRIYALTRAYKNILRLSIERSREIRKNEEIRGFNLRKRRTNYRTNKVGFNDLIFLLFHIIIFASYLIERGYLNEIFNKFIL